MDASLRLAWTRIVTVEDYDEHMAAIGQAQAAAELTEDLVRAAQPQTNGRVVIVGAGTGQMLDFLEPSLLRPFQLTCTDLNPTFLARLQERLDQHGLRATILEDDIEQTALERTALEPGPDLLLATLVLEHIDWRRGVEVFAGLRPKACGIILQENPPGMTSSVTPGRRIPPSIAKAIAVGHATLVPQHELTTEFEARGYGVQARCVRQVADGKRLVGLLLKGDLRMLTQEF
jgi:SAM-dependent methyltransferase